MLSNAFPLIPLTLAELIALLPLFTLSIGAVLALIVGTCKEKGHGYAFAMSFGATAAALVQGTIHLMGPNLMLLGGTLAYTPYTRTVSVMLIALALIALVFTYGHDKKDGLLSEVYALIMFSTAGMVLMVSTSHLLFMFIALEIMSLAIYVLVAMRRSSQFSAEAGLKYFILGGLASALFLYGTALVFGSTGSFELPIIESVLMSGKQSMIYYFGLGFIICGMLFKVGAFPFHGWVPDVYQGASTNVTGFMGAAVKLTAFIAFAKICQHLVFVDNVPGLQWFKTFIWFAAAASMIYGNFVAIAQNEIKRMLSFSTIAHTGYLLLGLNAMSGGSESAQSLVVYLFFYAVANIGAFAVIASFEEKNQKDLTFDQIAGLGMRHPVLGTLFTIFLLSMAGIPLTSGFIGKYGLFSSAVTAGEVPLVVIAVLTSVVSVYYYLRVIVYLFMKEEGADAAKYQKLKGAGLAALISAAATLQFGVFPKAILHFIKMIAK